VDHRSDIFSLGAILYEMISGNRAFAGDSSADVITAILKSDPPELPANGAPMPPGMQRIIQHCLEKDPEERFQSVRDLAFDLEMISGMSGASSSTSTAAAVEPQPRKKSLPLSVILPVGLAIVFAAGMLLGKYFLGSSTNSTSPSGTPQVLFQKLTDVPGEEYDPSLSPDGKNFVYVSTRHGNADIFLSRVGGSNAINLTQRSTANDSQPVFSPSGDQIAFRSDRDGGGIFLMGASGESIRRLTDFGYFPSWSADGKEIIFSTEFNDPLHAGGNTEVWTVNVENGQKKKLLDGRDFSAPRWDQKGNRIVYWGLVPGAGQRDIWMSDPTGKEIVAVTNDSFVDWNPVWSPDGKYLYFISDRSGSMNIARLTIDQKSGKVLGSPENMITPSAWIENLSFSSNPNQLVYAAFDRRSEIRKFSFDPVQEKIAAQSEEISSSTDFYDVLQVSPDGGWLTFFTVWPRQDIFVAKTDGSEKTRLTDDGYRNRYPSWSADGKSVVFMSDRSGKYDFWTIQKDGSNLTQTTRDDNMLWQPHYSPDGKSVSAKNESGTYIYDATALPWSNLTKLPEMGSNPENPFMAECWSHDGKSAAGTRYNLSRELVIYSVEQRSYKIIPFPADITFGGTSIAGWLPDDRRLLLTSGKLVLIADTQTGEVRKVSEFDAEIFGAKLSLDGRVLYVQRTISQSDIWMATLQ
jgi:Tol biopolymer transport system component